MKKYGVILILLLVGISSICTAQTDKATVVEDFKPSSVNQPGKEYPQVNSEGDRKSVV